MIAVAIVEDIKDIREGLRLLIDTSNGFLCREVYGSAEEATEGFPELQADVVVTAINLPSMNGIDCVKHLKQQCTNTQLIMTTVYEDGDNIFESLKAGATGYLLKKTEPVKILEA